MNLSLVMILLALAALIYFSFKGMSVLVLAPLLSAIMVTLSGDMSGLFALTGPFMAKTAGYVQTMFPIFVTGAIFGKIMADTGAAKSVAHKLAEVLGADKAILAVLIATALLTYGGVSLFVVVFVVYEIGVELFNEADIPKRLLPGVIALGAFTFTMTALPGSPQALNALPTTMLGTTIFAGPILGLIGAAVMAVGGYYWLVFRAKKLKAAGEGFGEELATAKLSNENLPNFWTSLTPILIIVALNTIFVFWVFKMASVKAFFESREELVNGTINGNWAVIIALTVAIIASLILFRERIGNITEHNAIVKRGAEASVLPLFATAAIVGFGGVVQSMAGFEVFKTWITGLDINGFWKIAISTTGIAGIVGSSSGGTGIALSALGEQFLAMGLNPEAIHRVMLIAAGGLDSLPHCGAVVVLLSVCGISHKKGYADIGMVTVVIPLIATIVTVLAAIAGIV